MGRSTLLSSICQTSISVYLAKYGLGHKLSLYLYLYWMGRQAPVLTIFDPHVPFGHYTDIYPTNKGLFINYLIHLGGQRGIWKDDVMIWIFTYVWTPLANTMKAMTSVRFECSKSVTFIYAYPSHFNCSKIFSYILYPKYIYGCFVSVVFVFSGCWNIIYIFKIKNEFTLSVNFQNIY